MTLHQGRRLGVPGRRTATGAALGAALLLLPGAGAPAAPAPANALPPSALAVHDGARWVEWWRSADAPARWSAPAAPIARSFRWREAAPGLEWGELRLWGSGEAWRIRVVVARIDPRRHPLRLHARVERGAIRPWTVDDAPPDAALAVNAGQFSAAGPWGWVVHRGHELASPGVGPLSAAVVVDRAEGVRVLPADSLQPVRRAGGVVEAFQSYPMLLDGDGNLPGALRGAGGVDLAHRDARLAIGELRDGRVLVALTRFEGLGGALEVVPFGLTVPEMAALMGALGCRRATLLDGGISAQLLLRDPSTPGGRLRWPALRAVPLALVALRKGASGAE